MTFIPPRPGGGSICLIVDARTAGTWRTAIGLLEQDDSAIAVLGSAGIDIATGRQGTELSACSGPDTRPQKLVVFFGRREYVAKSVLSFQPMADASRRIGVVGKDSPEAKKGYLFLDFTQENAQEALAFAQRGGFTYILIYASTWASSYGSYPINPKAFPDGEAGLERVVHDAHEKGIKIGLHVLTGLVSKHDPLVRSVRPDPRLLVDDRTVLARDIAADSATIPATTDLASFPAEGAFYGNNKAGTDLRIDDEILRCPVVVKGGSARFESCQRGINGTRAAPHRAGTSILHLAERYGAYLADLHTSLKDDIAARVAHVINTTGVDMVYFDGGEVMSANGPASHWVAEEQIAVLERVQRPLLVEGSGLVPRLWPFVTRMATDDFAALAPTAYLDTHKIGRVLRSHIESHMPAQLGWLGLLPETLAYPATTPEDVGTVVARSLAHNIPFSIETHVLDLRQNPYSERLLRAMRAGNAVLKRGVLSDAERERLQTGEWVYVERPQPGVARIEPSARRVENDGRETVLGAPPLGAIGLLLRIGDVSRTSADQSLALVPEDHPIVLIEPAVTSANRGIACDRLVLAGTPVAGDGSSAFIAFPSPAARKIGLDLSASRRMVVEYEIDGVSAKGACSVVNVQLEDGLKRYRDYFVDLRGGGPHRVAIEAGASAVRMLRDLMPAAGQYAFKAAIGHFDFGSVRAVNVRWMKTCEPGRALRITRISMLRELPGEVEALQLGAGGHWYTLAERLSTGETLELGADGALELCRNGECQPRGRLPQQPVWRAGEAIALRSRGGSGYTVKLMPIVDFIPLGVERMRPPVSTRTLGGTIAPR